MNRTMNNLAALLPLLALLGLLHGGTAGAAPTAGEPQPGEAAAPSKSVAGPVSFTLQPKDGRRQFHLGEIIPLQLSFQTEQAGIYVNPNAFVQSGGGSMVNVAGIPDHRAPTEDWQLDPAAGATDPLRDYGLGTGYNTTMVPVTNKPVTVDLDLNDWLRFDRPGTYRLADVTTRVYGLPSETIPGTKHKRPATVTSNSIELEILPSDAQWEEQALQSARHTLDTATDLRERYQAMRVLRFLGTVAAAHELVAHFAPNSPAPVAASTVVAAVPSVGDANRFDLQRELERGLYGSPQRAEIIQEMEKQLSAPDYTVSAAFLHILTDLTLKSHGSEPQRPQGQQMWDPDWNRRYDDARRQWDEARQQLAREHWQQVLEALPRKRGPAQGASLAALFYAAPGLQEERATAEWAALLGRLQTLTVELFPQLDAGVQRGLLTISWSKLRTPAMVPVLQRLLAQPPHGADAVHAPALAALYDLDPALARPLFLQEIAHPGAGSDFATLSRLPDATLPALDTALVANLARTLNTPEAKLDSQLLARYASPAVSGQVRQLYGKLDWTGDCTVRTELLAYLFHADAATATQLLHAAWANPAEANCKTPLAYGLMMHGVTPELERVAIAHLQDPNPWLVQEVATLLSYGSAAAEAPLWQRLRQFREQWKDRVSELEADTPASRMQRSIEFSLVSALSQGRAWNSFPTGLQRMRDLVLTKSAQTRIDSDLHQSAIIHLTYHAGPTGPEVRWNLLWYSGDSLNSLEQKLAQFQLGTLFSVDWDIDTPQRQADRGRLQSDLAAFAQQYGMRLVGA
jgi:hypothetical protein